MGDWIIRQLMAKEGTPTNASLTGKLIISDSSMVSKRLDLLLNSIIEKIQAASNLPYGSTQQATFIANFRQFVLIFIRSLRYAAKTLKVDEPIDLGVSDKTVLDAIALLNPNKKDVNLDINSQILEMFIILILVPPEPFKNTGVDCVSFAIDTLLTAPSSEE